MEKRVVFRSAWLPYALVAPQIAITIVFFFWPAAQAFWYSFQLQDAFGLNTEFVGLRNFQDLFRDSHYLDAFKVTAVFSVLVAGRGIAVSLVLATMADRVVRGALVYRTLLIWPYAVAPAVAGVLWAFMFAPSIGICSYVLKRMGVDWNWVIRGNTIVGAGFPACLKSARSRHAVYFTAASTASSTRCGPSIWSLELYMPAVTTTTMCSLSSRKIRCPPFPFATGTSRRARPFPISSTHHW